MNIRKNISKIGLEFKAYAARTLGNVKQRVTVAVNSIKDAASEYLSSRVPLAPVRLKPYSGLKRDSAGTSDTQKTGRVLVVTHCYLLSAFAVDFAYRSASQGDILDAVVFGTIGVGAVVGGALAVKKYVFGS